MAACSKINTRVVTFTTYYQFNQRTVFTQKTNKQKYSKGWKHHIANSSEQNFFFLSVTPIKTQWVCQGTSSVTRVLDLAFKLSLIKQLGQHCSNLYVVLLFLYLFKKLLCFRFFILVLLSNILKLSNINVCHHFKMLQRTLIIKRTVYVNQKCKHFLNWLVFTKDWPNTVVKNIF